MPFLPDRRAVLASLGLLASAGRVSKATAQPARSDADRPAEIIDDPRVSSFEIGPDDGNWRIFIGLPSAPAPENGYSALVALDGNSLFPRLWHHREREAPDAPVVLVGIGYPIKSRIHMERRMFDLTSPEMQPVEPAHFTGRGPGDYRTGGRSAYLRQIETAILPGLHQRVKIDPGNMTLFGHSLGGLFALHVLFARPTLFSRYVAADPSIWWNANEALREAEAFAGGIAAAGGRLEPARDLLISTSGRRSDGGRAAPRTDTPRLIENLSRLDGLNVTYSPHPDETHGSLVEPAALEALRLHLGRPL
ncbi:alpha/beta hydrolase [Paracoccus caeni]|uniref:Alpha/beta hydrolase n=1 Tax=Paracoccus caeni TaxID=657651 RepID=A0A934SAQ3_9RHOB|nr:alpha/beta hydrolase-fold protein [Paracoccus caeni]MBK4215331.1 alpha/beta hydrolase [Paracoccus caeni]